MTDHFMQVVCVLEYEVNSILLQYHVQIASIFLSSFHKLELLIHMPYLHISLPPYTTLAEFF